MSDLTIIYSHGMCGYGRLGFLDRRFVQGLRSTGIDTRVSDWARYANPLRNLHDREQHGRAAAQLRQIIADVRRDDPARRIAVIAHSTGCLVTLEALAGLDEPVDHAVFMAAAVDPAYDLTRITRGARRVVNLYSRLDVLVCMAGTAVMGTADAARRPSAGWCGFARDVVAACGIDQRPWRPAWLRYGHAGLHVGYLDPRFASGMVVPMVLGDRSPVAAGSAAVGPLQCRP